MKSPAFMRQVLPAGPDTVSPPVFSALQRACISAVIPATDISTRSPDVRPAKSAIPSTQSRTEVQSASNTSRSTYLIFKESGAASWGVRMKPRELPFNAPSPAIFPSRLMPYRDRSDQPAPPTSPGSTNSTEYSPDALGFHTTAWPASPTITPLSLIAHASPLLAPGGNGSIRVPLFALQTKGLVENVPAEPTASPTLFKPYTSPLPPGTEISNGELGEDHTTGRTPSGPADVPPTTPKLLIASGRAPFSPGKGERFVTEPARHINPPVLPPVQITAPASLMAYASLPKPPARTMRVIVEPDQKNAPEFDTFGDISPAACPEELIPNATLSPGSVCMFCGTPPVQMIAVLSEYPAACPASLSENAPESRCPCSGGSSWIV